MKAGKHRAGMKTGFVLALLTTATVFAEQPWPKIEFTEVKAYAWPGSLEVEEVVLPEMKLREGVLNREGAVLTAAEVKALTAAVTGKHKATPIAGCYSPHNAFVFYDAAKKPVAFVEICFTCLGKRIEPAGAAEHIDFNALAHLFTAHQLPLGRYPDTETFISEQKRMEKAQKETMQKLQAK